MRLRVDESLCAGYGNCTFIAEDLFEIDPGTGIARVLDGAPAGEARERALDAVRACPASAIAFAED